jgi:4-amino-4-deoxychorismate lyase
VIHERYTAAGKKTVNNWLINGEPGDRIVVTDRGFTYGDGLFETIAVRDGTMRFINHHLTRLLEGAGRLGIAAPERELLTDEAAQLAAGCDYGTLKIILTRGPGRRGYAPPVPADPLRCLGLLPGVRPARDKYIRGIAVRHCSTPIGSNPATAGLKTLGRLEQVIARAEWQDESISEGLMSTADGLVVCGTMSNLFLVQDGTLVVPDLSTCGIKGIMRSVVLDRTDQLGLERHYGDVPRAALSDADELFVTNSLIGIWPICRIETRKLAIGPVTRTLMAELAQAGVEECAIT